jgi:hypothetical protein
LWLEQQLEQQLNGGIDAGEHADAEHGGIDEHSASGRR